MRFRRPRKRAWIIRVSIALFLALPIGWLTLAVSAARAGAVPGSGFSYLHLPGDARAAVALADTAVAGGIARPELLASAERLLRDALQRDPTLAAGWRALGMIAAARGDAARARTMFHSSQRVSRRDRLTQLWLIEERVAEGDIRGALHHYDVALRTSNASAELLLPLLVGATAETAVIEPLADLLLTAPPWRRSFLGEMASRGPPSSENARLLIEMLAGGGALPDRDLLAYLPTKLSEQRQFGAGWQIYQLLYPGRARQPVRNADFAGANPSPPFDWSLVSSADLWAEQRGIAGADRTGLEVRAGAGQGGQVAAQLLMLTPGHYQFLAEARPVEEVGPARLRWQILCRVGVEASLAEVDLIPREEGNPTQSKAAFIVPAGCTAQELTLSVLGDRGVTVGGWVSEISVRPQGS